MNRINWTTVLIIGAVALLFFLIGLSLFGGWGMMGGWDMMGPGMMGRWGFGLLGMLGMVLMWLIPLALVALLVLGIVWLVRAVGGSSSTNQPTRACPNCGRSVQPDWRSCPYCGQALE